jgi:hypothetical protein
MQDVIIQGENSLTTITISAGRDGNVLQIWPKKILNK